MRKKFVPSNLCCLTSGKFPDLIGAAQAFHAHENLVHREVYIYVRCPDLVSTADKAAQQCSRQTTGEWEGGPAGALDVLTVNWDEHGLDCFAVSMD